MALSETPVRAQAAATRRPGGARPRYRRGGGSLTHPAHTAWVLVTPALLFVTVFVLAPLLFAVYISLTNWPLIGSYRFVGLGNYTALFRDSAFARSVLYTLIYTGIVTLPILVVGYLMAVVVRARRRGSTLLRTVFFLPYVIGLSVLSFMTVSCGVFAGTDSAFHELAW